MGHYKYLIIGGGMTGDAATRGIRDVDGDGTIGMLAQEPDPPYNRPPLSKGLWQGRPVSRIWRKTADQGVDVMVDCAAASIDPAGKTVTDQRGATHTYDRLLIATGGRPRKLPNAPGDDRVIYFRTYRDYERLRGLADSHDEIGIVGGGYIGSEVAASLASVGKRVTMIMPEETINGPKYPPELGNFLNEYYRERGVTVMAGHKVTGIEARGDRRVIHTEGPEGGERAFDAVVLGLGIEPNVELANGAGLEVENGIVVDEQLRTSQPDIYAAGDVASVVKPALGKRLRIEHEDNANVMGRHAGRNMAGQAEPFHYLPYFYSDLFDLSYEAVGELGAKLDMVQDWQEPLRQGVIYYLSDGRVRGALLWGLQGKVDEVRRLIQDEGPFEAADLAGRIRG